MPKFSDNSMRFGNFGRFFGIFYHHFIRDAGLWTGYFWCYCKSRQKQLCLLMFKKEVTMSFIKIINHGHKLTILAQRIFYFPTGDWRVLVSLYKAIFEIGSRISISKILAQKGKEVPWPWESSTRQTDTERAITKQALFILTQNYPPWFPKQINFSIQL